MPGGGQQLGRLLLAIGILLAVMGLIMMYHERLPGVFRHLGRLPGDISVERNGVSFYFPLTTCIIISIVLSVIFWFTGRK